MRDFSFEDGKFDEEVRDYNTKSEFFPITHNVPLAAGQVRVLTNSNIASKKIVVIAAHNPASQTCDVLLTHDYVEVAIDREFIHEPEQTTSSLAFTIMADYNGNVDSVHLENSPVVGKLCVECVTTLLNQSTSPNLDIFQLPNSHSCLKRGEYPMIFLDSMWTFRLKEYEEFRLMSNIFANRKEFLQEKEFLFHLNIDKEIFDISVIIDQLNSPEDIKNYLKSYDENDSLQGLVGRQSAKTQYANA